MAEFKIIKPDYKFMKRLIKSYRSETTINYPGTDEKRMEYEISLLNYVTQNKLIETIEKSIKSQDRLANTQILLALVGAVIALFQLVSMFIVPSLGAS